MKYFKLTEDEIKERYYKGEITYREAKRQLENLIAGFKKKQLEEKE